MVLEEYLILGTLRSKQRMRWSVATRTYSAFAWPNRYVSLVTAPKSSPFGHLGQSHEARRLHQTCVHAFSGSFAEMPFSFVASQLSHGTR